MKYKKIFDSGSNDLKKVTYALCFDKGDDVASELEKFINKEQITFANFSGIGAFEDTVIGLYENGEYKKFTYKQLVEVVNFTGNITFKDNEPKIHTHTTLSYEEDNDIKTLAGHFFSAKVAVTLEIILHSYNTKIERKYNQDSKIDTWNL